MTRTNSFKKRRTKTTTKKMTWREMKMITNTRNVRIANRTNSKLTTRGRDRIGRTKRTTTGGWSKVDKWKVKEKEKELKRNRKGGLWRKKDIVCFGEEKRIERK